MVRTEYTVGFLHNDSEVVLVRKNRPEWQAGKLNGVGGHVEEFDDSPHACQVREFEEETGVLVPKWEHFLTLEGTKSLIHAFAAHDTGGWIRQVKSTTDELIVVKNIYSLFNGFSATVPNLKWIIPLMMQRGNYYPVVVNFYGD
jgi:8-oxo-dGTP diphosphatase